MKKKIFLALVFCMFFSTTKISAAPIDTNFKDDNFYNCIIESYNTKNGGNKTTNDTLTQEELDTIEHINCPNQGIVDISGIEKLNSLTTINLSKNEITSITPIEQKESTILETLNLEENKIERIDLSKNTGLTTLNLKSNPLAQKISIPVDYSLDIGTYVKLPSEYTIDLEIADTSIAEFNKTRKEITPKKKGKTTAIIKIKKTATTEEMTFNSTITITKQSRCMVIGGSSTTIKFNTTGGNQIEDINICNTCGDSNKTVSTPTPTKDGYKFVGWYYDENYTSEFKESTISLSNINTRAIDECENNWEATLYAKWEKIETTDKKSTSDTTKNPKTGIYGGSIALVALAVGTYAIIKIKEKKNTI